MQDMPDNAKWPSVDAAYNFVLPSYQLLASRFEAADGRLTALLTLASTLTIAVPIFAKSVQPDISFASPFFQIGVIAFLIGAIVGIIGRVRGGLMLPDPMILYNKNLADSEWEFKKNQIYFAGQDFESNAEVVRNKSNCAILMTGALLAEIMSFVVWLTH